MHRRHLLSVLSIGALAACRKNDIPVEPPMPSQSNSAAPSSQPSPSPSPSPSRKLSRDILWHRDRLERVYVAHDGGIVVRRFDGSVVALDPATGRELGTILGENSAPDPFRRIIVSNGMAMCVTDTETTTHDLKSGKLLAKFRPQSEVDEWELFPAALARIEQRDLRNRVTVFDPRTGRQRSQWRMPAEGGGFIRVHGVGPNTPLLIGYTKRDHSTDFAAARIPDGKLFWRFRGLIMHETDVLAVVGDRFLVNLRPAPNATGAAPYMSLVSRGGEGLWTGDAIGSVLYAVRGDQLIHATDGGLVMKSLTSGKDVARRYFSTPVAPFGVTERHAYAIDMLNQTVTIFGLAGGAKDSTVVLPGEYRPVEQMGSPGVHLFDPSVLSRRIYLHLPLGPRGSQALIAIAPTR